MSSCAQWVKYYCWVKRSKPIHSAFDSLINWTKSLRLFLQTLPILCPFSVLEKQLQLNTPRENHVIYHSGGCLYNMSLNNENDDTLETLMKVVTVKVAGMSDFQIDLQFNCYGNFFEDLENGSLCFSCVFRIRTLGSWKYVNNIIASFCIPITQREKASSFQQISN